MGTCVVNLSLQEKRRQSLHPFVIWQMDMPRILFEVAHGQEKEKCCQRLLDIAKKRGAPDNVTSILVAV